VVAEYATPREYLDDLVVLVERMLERALLTNVQSETDQRALAELDLDIVRRSELVAERRDITAERGERLPLDRVRVAFDLSETEARVLSVLAVLEIAAGARRAAAKLLADPGTSATIGLIENLVYRGTRDRGASSEELASDGRLFRFQLAEVGDRNLPWLARPVRAAPRVLELAMGRLRLDLDVARVATLIEEPPGGESLLIDAAIASSVTEAVRRHRELGPLAAIPLLVGPGGSGRTSLALAAAREAGLAALVVRARDLPRDADKLTATLRGIEREAILFGAVLIVRDLDALSGDTERGVPDLLPLAASVLAGHAGPLAITMNRMLWPPTNIRPTLVAEIRIPAEAERAILWQRVLGPFAADIAREAAARYRITGGTIMRATATARARAAGHGGDITLDDVRVGIRGQLDAELATLGRRIEWEQTWDDLVLPDDIIEELRELISRVQHRRRVLDDWGFARKVGKGIGISALFSGPPGTGKTMVAGLIARELQLDLYQIDASRMVSKWIGETEKNLARLFDAASAGHAVLLFDEADSLFAKRTEVKSSTDRYANLEVNYLLQRMEAFEGITILTTNLETSVDEAFRRRLAFRIAFPLPEREERKRLWRAMLPAEAAVETNIDFDLLAERFEMSGGYIRNAVIRAAYLAAADGGKLGMRHLQRAGMLEYTAMGKIIHASSAVY
jgi:hypothetical protein